MHSLSGLIVSEGEVMCRNSFRSIPVILLFLAAVSPAGILHVPGDYSTIQTALDAAMPGDTVLVAPGTYYENLDWPNTVSVKLFSEQGAGSTTIDGSGSASVIRVHNSVIGTSTVIAGFTIENGINTRGGGICLENAASPTIENNIIQYCSAERGGGICLESGAAPIIIDNIIQNCSVAIDLDGKGGAGISSHGSPTSALIQGNTIQNNTVSTGWMRFPVYGGGIYIGEGNGLQILDNLIMGNEIDSLAGGAMETYGGGLFMLGGIATISGNEFIENSAVHGSALHLGRNSIPQFVNVNISQCAFNANTSLNPSSVYNSCIAMSIDSASNISISNCSIMDNNVTGIWIEGSGVVSIDSSTITGNSSDGIRRDYGITSISAHYCNISDNDGYGVNNFQADEIDATYCWWGDPSGPGGVGPGTGDEVSDYVLYDPWLPELGIEEGICSDDLGLSLMPNPFSAFLAIEFETPTSGHVVLQVFDLSGRLIETLVAEDLQNGSHSIDLTSDGYSPGVYLLRLQFGSTIQTEKCVLLR